MKLINPYPEAKNRVQSDLGDEPFIYLFRQLFAGDRSGVRQCLINLFFQRLHAECLAQNLAPAYDPANESAVARIMSRLNFDDVAALVTDAELRGFDRGVAHVGATTQRTDPPKAKRKVQPRAGRRNATGRTDEVHPRGKKAGAVTGDSIRES